MPTVYNFDALTKAYSFKNEARESPREPGVFLLPANATWEEVPEYREGQVALWRDKAWEVVDLPSAPAERGYQLVPPDDLAPGAAPAFPDEPKDGAIAWSARDNGAIVKWTYNGLANTWDEELTGGNTGTSVPFDPEKYASKEYVHEYVEQRLAEALTSITNKVEQLKQADSA